MSQEESISSNEIRDGVMDMLNNVFEVADSAFNTSAADYHRFVHSKIYELTGRPYYVISREETHREGKKYVDEYINLMNSYYGDNFKFFLLHLSYPVMFYNNERGFKILNEKYTDKFKKPVAH